MSVYCYKISIMLRADRFLLIVFCVFRVNSSSFFSSFIKSIYSAFDCTNGDCEALFAISFFYALLQNQGIDKEILRQEKISLPEVKIEFLN